MIVIMSLFAAIFSLLLCKLNKEKDKNVVLLIIKGVLGGSLIGVLVGLFGGLVWGITLNLLSKTSYWDSVWLISKFMLLYGVVIGLIFGAIGYPLIIRKTNKQIVR